MMIYNKMCNRQLHHGVKGIIPNTEPNFWNQHEIAKYGKRFILQYRRCTDNDKLEYIPYFPIIEQ